jgi:hypothetical protein
MAATYPAYIEWPELRRAILAGGGIGPSPDWPRDWYPADLYRRHGKAPDLAAVETTLGYADLPPWGEDGGDVVMFTYLQRSYAEWQRWQAASTARWGDVYQLAREHGLAVRTVWLVVAEASLKAYRRAGNRRTLFEREAFAMAIEASPRAPRRKRARIVEELAA